MLAIVAGTLGTLSWVVKEYFRTKVGDKLMISNELMKYLGKAEGTTLHYNTSESDITTAYGIYRVAHPDAEIFKYIDRVADNIGITTKSKDWTTAEIDSIGIVLDDKNVLKLAEEFYTKFTLKAKLNEFPKEAQVAMFSMYTNSPKLAWKATQSAINKFESNELIDYKQQLVDGYPGETTYDGLELCTAANNGSLFEAYMLLEMNRQYGKLAVSNPDKYLQYLNGWNNRMEALAEF